MNGFNYNGVHNSELKVRYIPDPLERGDYFSDYEVIDEERSWFPGGDFYKTRVKSKVKSIECYYEQVTKGEKDKIIRWLDRRTSGKLWFDDRPYAVQYVRPTKRPEFKDYLQMEGERELYSGTFTITFTAYWPFADLIYTTLDEYSEHGIADETGVIYAQEMPAPVNVNDTNCLIYNPGTETGHSIIRVAGSTGSGDLIIRNTATGDVFKLIAGFSTDENEYYEISSKDGRVVKINLDGPTVDFMFHDEGYITFAPCFPMERNVEITTTAGSKTIEASESVFTEDMEGRYIYLDGEWKYIGNIISGTEAEVSTNNSTSASVATTIATLNYLTIEKAEDANITRLEIICLPEVR